MWNTSAVSRCPGLLKWTCRSSGIHFGSQMLLSMIHHRKYAKLHTETPADALSFPSSRKKNKLSGWINATATTKENYLAVLEIESHLNLNETKANWQAALTTFLHLSVHPGLIFWGTASEQLFSITFIPITGQFDTFIEIEYLLDYFNSLM